MSNPTNRFGQWLEATMQTRNLTQAEMAREVGVADAQVSRWRRGQVRPTVYHLQRIADTFGVSRVNLDLLAGYPVGEEGAQLDEPEREAEIQAYQARLRRVMEERVPRELWESYARACEALGETLSRSFQEATAALAEDIDAESKKGRHIGFRR